MFFLRFDPAAVPNVQDLEAELAWRLAGLFGVHTCLFSDGRQEPHERKPFAYDGPDQKIIIGSTNDHWLHPEGNGLYKVVARYKSPELMELYRQILDQELRTLRRKAFLGTAKTDPRYDAAA